MVYAEVIKHLKDFKFESANGLTDVADTFSSVWTIIVAFVFAALVTMKTYFLTPITCHAPVTFSGSNLSPFIDNFCWVEGSLAVTSQKMYKDFPSNEKEWNKLAQVSKITYYPWVPLILASFGLAPFLISVVWRVFYKKRTGTDLQAVVDLATDAQSQTGQEREKSVEKIVNGIVDTLNKNREYRQDRLTRIKLSVFNKIGYGFFSKRFGSWVNFSYFIVKLFYLLAHVGTLCVIHVFLDLDSYYKFFGFQVMYDILNGRYWHETGLFPRVTFCRVPVRHQVEVNSVYAQCVLPINMLNELVFVFVWFWQIFGIVGMICSIFAWLYRTASEKSRTKFLRKFLMLSGAISHESGRMADRQIRLFATHFLQHDGVFLLRMLDICVGARVTSDIVFSLWQYFTSVDDWEMLPRPFAPRHRYEAENMVINMKHSNGGKMGEETKV